MNPDDTIREALLLFHGGLHHFDKVKRLVMLDYDQDEGSDLGKLTVQDVAEIMDASGIPFKERGTE
jgi:hypothetical protein